jgi:hypothetical protein
MITETDNRISQVHNLVDDLFDGRQAKRYQLALQLGFDGISAAVWDDAFNKILALERFSFQKAFNINTLLNLTNVVVRQSQLLAFPYKKISLGIVNSKSTLVPLTLFEAGEKDALLKFNHVLEEGEITAVDNLPNLDAKNIFSLPKAVKQQFQELYPVLNIIHYSSPLIESILQRYKRVESQSVILCVQSGNFQILVITSGKLLFYNSFAFHTAEDFIYYVLFVLEQLKLNPETINMELLGELDKKSPEYQLLYKYIRNVKFGERPEAFDFSFKIAALPKQFFYSLFCQFLLT